MDAQVRRKGEINAKKCLLVGKSEIKLFFEDFGVFLRMMLHVTVFIFVRTESRLQQNSTYSDAGYPDQLVPSGKFAENSTKLTGLEITGNRIKYSISVMASGTANQAWSKG